MLYLYNFFIRCYSFAIHLAARWNKKAAAWVEGRRELFLSLEKHIASSDRFIWMHCSSAGEFEQGKPVIEALKTRYPEKKILVTFFSPSGYQAARNYRHADLITYLPLDTRENARRFYQAVKPELALFVKYEFWYHHLSVAAFYHTPLLLVSAVFRKEQIFFKPYGRFFRQMLHLFRHIFVQDKSSLQRLQTAGFTNCSISGDTRFDRVVKITETMDRIPLVEAFVAGKNVIVAGSTWPGDEAVLAGYLRENQTARLVIAPHEIDSKHIAQVRTLFPDAVLYTEVVGKSRAIAASLAGQTLIIDTIGLLSRLYRYATITYVGGGYTKDGIHNILEAAVWGKPVLFGPNYQKYREAGEMIETGGAYSFRGHVDFKRKADDLLGNEDHLQQMSERAKAYVTENTGATAVVLKTIQEKRLLTR